MERIIYRGQDYEKGGGIGAVETKYGKLQGVICDVENYPGITTFKGIPYAAPPVGELRWKPPADPEPWTGIKVCDKFGPAPMQDMSRFDDLEPWTSDFYYENMPEASEDSLYLNITTAASRPEEKRPVYMWFHGGGLTSGFSFEIEFEGSELAKKGIVVVTVGQRLNAFGLLSLPQLTAEQGSSGNYALMDELKALDWVRENIAAFGGDPDNITIGGQSGGTTKCVGLALSPRSKGKISKMILESGLKWDNDFRSLPDAEQAGRGFLEACGIDPDISLEELRKLDGKKLLENGRAMRNISGFVNDGVYLDCPSVSKGAENGALNGIPMIVGTNFGEASSDMELDKARLYEMYKEILGGLYDKYDFESLCGVYDENARVVQRCLASFGLAKKGTQTSRNLMVCRLFGKLMAGKGTPVYSYYFSHLTPGNDESVYHRSTAYNLAWHSSELWYAFASLRDGVPPVRRWEPWDYELADIMSSYWAGFMKTGNPNSGALPVWPQSDSSYSYIEFGDTVKSHYGLDKLGRLAREYVSEAFDMPL